MQRVRRSRMTDSDKAAEIRNSLESTIGQGIRAVVPGSAEAARRAGRPVRVRHGPRHAHLGQQHLPHPDPDHPRRWHNPGSGDDR